MASSRLHAAHPLPARQDWPFLPLTPSPSSSSSSSSLPTVADDTTGHNAVIFISIVSGVVALLVCAGCLFVVRASRRPPSLRSPNPAGTESMTSLEGWLREDGAIGWAALRERKRMAALGKPPPLYEVSIDQRGSGILKDEKSPLGDWDRLDEKAPLFVSIPDAPITCAVSRTSADRTSRAGSSTTVASSQRRLMPLFNRSTTDLLASRSASFKTETTERPSALDRVLALLVRQGTSVHVGVPIVLPAPHPNGASEAAGASGGAEKEGGVVIQEALQPMDIGIEDVRVVVV